MAGEETLGLGGVGTRHSRMLIGPLSFVFFSSQSTP